MIKKAHFLIPNSLKNIQTTLLALVILTFAGGGAQANWGDFEKGFAGLVQSADAVCSMGLAADSGHPEGSQFDETYFQEQLAGQPCGAYVYAKKTNAHEKHLLAAVIRIVDQHRNDVDFVKVFGSSLYTLMGEVNASLLDYPEHYRMNTLLGHAFRDEKMWLESFVSFNRAEQSAPPSFGVRSPEYIEVTQLTGEALASAAKADPAALGSWLRDNQHGGGLVLIASKPLMPQIAKAVDGRFNRVAHINIQNAVEAGDIDREARARAAAANLICKYGLPSCFEQARIANIFIRTNFSKDDPIQLKRVPLMQTASRQSLFTLEYFVGSEAKTSAFRSDSLICLGGFDGRGSKGPCAVPHDLLRASSRELNNGIKIIDAQIALDPEDKDALEAQKLALRFEDAENQFRYAGRRRGLNSLAKELGKIPDAEVVPYQTVLTRGSVPVFYNLHLPAAMSFSATSGQLQSYVVEFDVNRHGRMRNVEISFDPLSDQVPTELEEADMQDLGKVFGDRVVKVRPPLNLAEGKFQDRKFSIEVFRSAPRVVMQKTRSLLQRITHPFSKSE